MRALKQTIIIRVVMELSRISLDSVIRTMTVSIRHTAALTSAALTLQSVYMEANNTEMCVRLASSACRDVVLIKCAATSSTAIRLAHRIQIALTKRPHAALKATAPIKSSAKEIKAWVTHAQILLSA